MTKRHFFLYDFLLPIVAILAAGTFLSNLFDASLLRWLDTIKPFGIGARFSHSALRGIIWEYSWLAFSAAPALLWMIWVRINIEHDWINHSRRLDRPIYTFVRGLLRWVDGTGGGDLQRKTAEFRAFQAEDRTRRLEAELSQARQAYARLKADYQDEDEYEDLEMDPVLEAPVAQVRAPAPVSSKRFDALLT